MPLLDQLQFPNDLKKLSITELDQLASEIRTRLIDICHACGGHLASNLGVVELTLVLHAIFDSPKDQFVWDTSHQTYVHKMLTNRLQALWTLRQDNGLSGFAKISESEHDIFGAGHASTALSAALGLAHAREMQGKHHAVVAIIGDATLSGGMAFEALNNVEALNKNFICVLNDNNMSISPPVGSMATYITKVRTSQAYVAAKLKFDKVVSKFPKIGVPLKKLVEKTLDHMRDFVLDLKEEVIFQEFGFKYLGPIDGHDIPLLMTALKYAKSYPGPILIHIVTQKGKGHQPAEKDPVTYHGVSPKKKDTTPTIMPSVQTYSQVFGQTVSELAKHSSSIAVITPAMSGGSGLDAFSKTYPHQFFDVGIAEEHAITFAAGLSKGGIKPIVAIYSTFLQRGFDQLIHDVCLQELPMVLALDRAGFVGEDGPTHHGVLDFSYLLPIPNMVVTAPKDGSELTALLHWAVSQDAIVSIRYPRGPIPDESEQIQTPIQEGSYTEVLYAPQEDRYDVVVVAIGAMAWPAYQTALSLKNFNILVLNPRVIKPIDQTGILPYLLKTKHVLVVEEGHVIGGVGSFFQSFFNQELRCSHLRWHVMGVPDQFVDHGKMSTLRQKFGLTSSGIAEKIKQILK